MTLGEMLERSAERYPEKIAIVFKDQRVTYKALNAQANKLGRALNALGIGRDDKVGILMPNCPELIVGVFGALKAGGVFVVLNALLSGRELTYVINNSDIKIIVTAPPYDDLLAMLRPQIPQVQQIITLNENPEDESLLIYHHVIEPYDDTNLKPSVSLDDIAALYYTSGTTGLPKGAMLTHVNILSSTVAIGKVVNVSRNDVPLNCLPLFHTLAMTACIMVPIFGGMTNVLLEGFLPHPVLQGFTDWKVTVFVGIPTMFAVLANMPHLERYDISHLRIGYSGGAPLTTSIADKFESKFPCKIHEGYGLSECSPLVSANPLGNRKIGSIGKAVDRVSWQIVDKNRHEVPRNTVGEIAVSGPNVMKGYYKNEEATREVMSGEEGCKLTQAAFENLKKEGLPGAILQKLLPLKDQDFPREPRFLAVLEKQLGKDQLARHQEPILRHTRQRWFYTGDLAYMDEDGFVFIADRKKDMIIVGGENVYPKEVENVLTQYPGIEDAGVIGIEDPIRGEVPKAYIVPKLGASIDEKDVLSFCRKYLAPYKIPRSIQIVDEIPKNVTGKILKRVLRRIEAGLPADEDEEDFDRDFEEEEELETVAEVVEAPKIPAPPTGGGLSLEEQIRLLEGGGATPPPPQAAGLSLEEQMKLLAGGEADEDEEEEPPPTPRAKPVSHEEVEGEEVERFEFEEPLRQLVMEVPGGIAGSIVGFDGIEVASFSTDPDFQTITADAELAGIMSALKKAAQSLTAGKPQEAYFATERYGFVLKAVRDQFFVSLVLEAKELNLGLTRLHISKIVPLIEAELF
jgi:long-chain acyl-CoA synthetase